MSRSSRLRNCVSSRLPVTSFLYRAMNGTVEPSSRSCTVAATCRGCTFNSVAMRWTILSATVSIMGVCVSLLAHQGLFVPRISLAFHCKPREHVCRVGEAGHFAINAGGLWRSVIEFRHCRSCYFAFLLPCPSPCLPRWLSRCRLSAFRLLCRLLQSIRLPRPVRSHRAVVLPLCGRSCGSPGL